MSGSKRGVTELGSHSAVAWDDDDTNDEAAVRDYLSAVTTRATETLTRCGFRPDEHMATASSSLFVRPLSLWRREANSFLVDPTQEKALILASVLVDSRPVWGVDTGPLISDAFRLAPSYPHTLRLLAQFALSHKPPTGFLRGLAGRPREASNVVASISRSAAVVPITDLARWAGMTVGVACASTTARLEAAPRRGVRSAHADAESLT